MGPVFLDVVARPDETVAPSCKPVRPEVGAPEEERPLQLAADSLLDDSAHRIGAVVGGRLGVEARDRVAGERAAREVDELHIGIADAHDPDDRAEIRLEPARVLREAALLTRDGLLEPDRLNLPRLDVGFSETLVDVLPEDRL